MARRTCNCPCGCPEPWQRNVIYAGPCPPGPNCPCQPILPPPPPDPPCYRPIQPVFAYACYAQVGCLQIERPGDPVPLNTTTCQADGAFEACGGVITVMRTGTFLATFTMTLPDCAELNAEIGIQFDCEVLPGSVVSITKAAGSPSSVTTQAVFTVRRPGAQLAVVASQPLCLTAPSPQDTLASLTITQVNGGLMFEPA
ncbi:MAG: hypothetical protein RSD95_11620 [Clostridia bacterium]